MANPGPLPVRVPVTAALRLAGMVPQFLALFVVLPVPGHSGRHMRRRLAA